MPSSVGLVCFRSPEIAAALHDYCKANGVSLSSVCRIAVANLLGVGLETMDLVNKRAYEIATNMLRAMGNELPKTYEEAVERGLLDPTDD